MSSLCAFGQLCLTDADLYYTFCTLLLVALLADSSFSLDVFIGYSQ